MTEPKHWIFRANDGVNFLNSKYGVWGIIAGQGGCHKTLIKQIQVGDVLWFCTSKPYGGEMVGMAEYVGYYDRQDEPILQIHTYSNEDMGWTGGKPWDIQIHYRNLYYTQKQHIKVCVACAATMMRYETFRERIEDDLYVHYRNYKFYAEPVPLPNIGVSETIIVVN